MFYFKRVLASMLLLLVSSGAFAEFYYVLRGHDSSVRYSNPASACEAALAAEKQSAPWLSHDMRLGIIKLKGSEKNK